MSNEKHVFGHSEDAENHPARMNWTRLGAAVPTQSQKLILM